MMQGMMGHDIENDNQTLPESIPQAPGSNRMTVENNYTNEGIGRGRSETDHKET